MSRRPASPARSRTPVRRRSRPDQGATAPTASRRSPASRGLSPVQRTNILASPPIKLQKRPKRGILSTRKRKRKRKHSELCPATAEWRPNKRVKFTGSTTIVNFRVGSPSVTHTSIQTPRFLSAVRPRRTSAASRGFGTSKRRLLDTLDDENSNPPALGLMRSMSAPLTTVSESPDEESKFPFQRMQSASASCLLASDSNSSDCSSNLSTSSPRTRSTPSRVLNAIPDECSSPATTRLSPSVRSLISQASRLVEEGSCKRLRISILPQTHPAHRLETSHPALLLNNMIKTTATNTRLRLERKGVKFFSVEHLLKYAESDHCGLETYASRDDIPEIPKYPREKLIDKLAMYYFPESMKNHSLMDLAHLWTKLVEKDLEAAREKAQTLLDKDITARGFDPASCPTYVSKIKFLKQEIQKEEARIRQEDEQLSKLEGIICDSQDEEVREQLGMRERARLQTHLQQAGLPTEGSESQLRFRAALWKQVMLAAQLEKIGYGGLAEMSDERIEELFEEQKLDVGDVDDRMTPLELRLVKEEKIAQAVREGPEIKSMGGWEYCFGSSSWEPSKVKQQAKNATPRQIISELRKSRMPQETLEKLEKRVAAGFMTHKRLVKEFMRQMLNDWLYCIHKAIDRELKLHGIPKETVARRPCPEGNAVLAKFALLEERHEELQGTKESSAKQTDLF